MVGLLKYSLDESEMGINWGCNVSRYQAADATIRGKRIKNALRDLHAGLTSAKLKHASLPDRKASPNELLLKALNLDADGAAVFDRVWLFNPHTGRQDAGVNQTGGRDPFRQGLDQIDVFATANRADTLGHLIVANGIAKIVTGDRPAIPNGHIDGDDDRLRRLLFVVVDTDGRVDRQFPNKDMPGANKRVGE